MGEQSPQSAQIKPTLVPPSASFRLRSKSLNSVRLRRVFDLFDKNGDEYITVAEMADALARLGLITDPSELALTISGFIRPGAIGLDFNDFQVLHRTLGDALFGTDPINPSENNSDESDMREAFNVFDEDGDGFISAKELKTVLEKLGLAEGESMDRVQIMICSVDQDHDGRVDFDSPTYPWITQLGVDWRDAPVVTTKELAAMKTHDDHAGSFISACK